MSDQATIDPATFAKLKEIPDSEWIKIYSDLVIYADARLRRCNFVVRSEKDSVSTEDFVTDGIARVFSGVRKWDFERFPSILIHLKGVIKSLISSHLKSSNLAAKKVLVKDIEIIGIESDDDWQSLYLDQPDEIIFKQEVWEAIERKFNDDEGYLFFLEWVDGKSPRDIAADWSIDATTIYAAVKKGKRVVKEIILNN